jgi:dihydrofolate synthase/folylpolyglutamate synthase
VNYSDALQYLDDHASYERTGRIDGPSLDRIAHLCTALGDPQRDFRVVHVTGTNGKGSTSQFITRLLMAHGLRVGTYSSPHVEDVRERIQVDAVPVGEDDFTASVASVAVAEGLSGIRPSYFEILTAAAFRCFSDTAVDVAVIEVGLLGRWDATNVVTADVAVVTNIALDHVEFAGPTLADIAREKAGIIKPDSIVVSGEDREELTDIFRAEPHASMRVVGEDFAVVDDQLALGGRSVHVRTSRGDLPGLFVPMHGRHQSANVAVALAAVEEFFDAPVHPDVAAEALAAAWVPGRFEVLGHQPLVIVDAAHNPAGADVCAEVFFSDFDPPGRRILVVGAIGQRDLVETLSAFRADEFDTVVCCTAPSPRARTATEVAAAARAIGCDAVVVVESVGAACDAALRDAGADDAILVTGSFYVVGDAKAHLRRVLT